MDSMDPSHPRRYTLFVLGGITLTIFFLRFAMFRFRESPRYLLAKGYDAHALDVVYSIAKFNGSPEPRLSLEDFEALDWEQASRSQDHGRADAEYDPRKSQRTPKGSSKWSKNLMSMFSDPVYTRLFVIMAIA